MARLLKQDEGKRLGLPGRTVLEMVSGEIDSIVTLLGFEEVSYFVMFAWLAIAGAAVIVR